MSEVFLAVLKVSLSASVLILMALAVRLIAGRRPGVLLPLLSALILLRLAVPVNIPSPMSVQNLFTGMNLPALETAAAPRQAEAPQPAADEAGLAIPDSASEKPEAVTPANGAEMRAALKPLSAVEVCAAVWIAGMAMMAACVFFSNVRFSRMLKKNRAYAPAGFEALLNRCKAELNVRHGIQTVQVSDINTAAVYGIFRPKLLISPSFGWLSEAEKRHVLLHELSHIQRRDTALSLLMTVLGIVHWFNPLAWVALALARKDIETVCDIAVLQRTNDRRGYAGTLLRLAETAQSRTPRLAAALFIWRPQNGQMGVLVSTYSIKRRIKMIARYKKSPVMTVLALALAVALAATGCTGAVPEGSVKTNGNTDAVTENTDALTEKTVDIDENTDRTMITVTSGDGSSAFIMFEEEGQEYIAAYILDIGSIAGDEARIANINKAVEMLDGTVYPHWDESLTATEDMNRQINIPDVLGPITEEAGWQNAAWTGWGPVGVYIHENDTRSGFFKADTLINPDDYAVKSDMQTGGGIEIVAMAVHNAGILAGLDGGSSYTSAEDVSLYRDGTLADKYEEEPEDKIDTGGVGAINNQYASDLILRVWVQGGLIIAAFISDGPAKEITIPMETEAG